MHKIKNSVVAYQHYRYPVRRGATSADFDNLTPLLFTKVSGFGANNAREILGDSVVPDERVEPFPRGGVTLAQVCIDDKLYVGAAFCVPQDNYNARTGRGIALVKLLKALHAERVITGPEVYQLKRKFGVLNALKSE